MRIVLVGVVSLLFLGCARGAPGVRLATTTSLANSGLLEIVATAYDEPLRIIPAGSGRALTMLETGHADVVLSHAPAQEAAALARHPTWVSRKVLFNQFVIVGPADDPARIAGAKNAAVAMKQIFQSGARFLSRGDQSGTHERERDLWTVAGIDAAAPQIIVAGAGMGQTLRVASETGAYTLTDSGTFSAVAASLKLQVLVEGDARLLNTYSVVVDPENLIGSRFADWLATGEGRAVLSNGLTERGIRGFMIWPHERQRERDK